MIHSIFAEIHPSEQAQADNYPRFLEMSDAYNKELDRLLREEEAAKSPLQLAYEQHEREALGQSK
jgi:ABC-type transporter Mla subunit MlaD